MSKEPKADDALWFLDELIREHTHPSVARALEAVWYRRAAFEGRCPPEEAARYGMATGEYECTICGMRQWTLEAADNCCRPGVELYEWLVENGRITPGGGKPDGGWEW